MQLGIFYLETRLFLGLGPTNLKFIQIHLNEMGMFLDVCALRGFLSIQLFWFSSGFDSGLGSPEDDQPAYQEEGGVEGATLIPGGLWGFSDAFQQKHYGKVSTAGRAQLIPINLFLFVSFSQLPLSLCCMFYVKYLIFFTDWSSFLMIAVPVTHGWMTGNPRISVSCFQAHVPTLMFRTGMFSTKLDF